MRKYNFKSDQLVLAILKATAQYYELFDQDYLSDYHVTDVDVVNITSDVVDHYLNNIISPTNYNQFFDNGWNARVKEFLMYAKIEVDELDEESTILTIQMFMAIGFIVRSQLERFTKRKDEIKNDIHYSYSHLQIDLMLKEIKRLGDNDFRVIEGVYTEGGSRYGSFKGNGKEYHYVDINGVEHYLNHDEYCEEQNKIMEKYYSN